MESSKSETLLALIGDGEAAASRLPAIRAACARFVVIVPVPAENTWWVHRYEVPVDLLLETVAVNRLHDYERKVFDDVAAAVATAGEWAGSFAGFQGAIASAYPYP